MSKLPRSSWLPKDLAFKRLLGAFYAALPILFYLINSKRRIPLRILAKAMPRI